MTRLLNCSEVLQYRGDMRVTAISDYRNCIYGGSLTSYHIGHRFVEIYFDGLHMWSVTLNSILMGSHYKELKRSSHSIFVCRYIAV